jgi:hypothetical protein
MNQTTEDRSGAEFVEPGPLRMHEAHKEKPKPNRESPQWQAFVMACSAAGPEGIPPIVVTPLGEIMDGERRWLAAKQLQWDRIGVIRRPETEAPAIIVDSLLGQHHLTKGAKVYLVVPLLKDFIAASERRRLDNLRRGVKTIEKALIFPKPTELASGNGYQGICERLGCSDELLRQAINVRKVLQLPHKFEFQSGREQTLKEHFEPQILDAESPMGLGEVLKGCGWFVDENGNPKKQPTPGARNSHLAYFEAAWGNFNKQFGRWEKLKAAERERAMEVVTAGIQQWPQEVVSAVVAEGKKALTQSRKGAEAQRVSI